MCIATLATYRSMATPCGYAHFDQAPRDGGAHVHHVAETVIGAVLTAHNVGYRAVAVGFPSSRTLGCGGGYGRDVARGRRRRR
jgi:hypothetical protein